MAERFRGWLQKLSQQWFSRKLTDGKQRGWKVFLSAESAVDLLYVPRKRKFGANVVAVVASVRRLLIRPFERESIILPVSSVLLLVIGAVLTCPNFFLRKQLFVVVKTASSPFVHFCLV